MATPPLDHALWGVRIEEEGGQVIYERNSSRLFVPGSTRKLFVAATVADCYGLEATIPTRFLIRGSVTGPALQGDVIIQGFGDPSLGGRLEYETDRNRRFRPLLEWLNRNGVRRITGNVIADVSAFDDETIPRSWKTGNIGTYYSAPVDALAYNENVVGVRAVGENCPVLSAISDPSFVPVHVEAICGEPGDTDVRFTSQNEAILTGTVPKNGMAILRAVSDPALYTATALADFLGNAGIEVSGRAVVSRGRTQALLVAEGESVPLFALLAILLKNSQNLYGEMLFRRLAIGTPPATYASAARVEREFLDSTVKLADEDFVFEDGSGLSDENVVTPGAVVRLLRYLDADPSRKGAFWSLMASPGEEGTLSHRLLALQGRLRAKSGTLNMVNALAGSVRSSAGRRVRYFSIMVNQGTSSSARTNELIDEIVMAIAQF